VYKENAFGVDLEKTIADFEINLAGGLPRQVLHTSRVGYTAVYDFFFFFRSLKTAAVAILDLKNVCYFFAIKPIIVIFGGHVATPS